MDSRIRAILAATRGPSILDVGCVGGLQSDAAPMESPLWLHGHLVREFDDVWGIDLSPKRVTQLLKHGYANIHVANAETFSLDKKFDTIVAGELIEHLPNPGLFLDRCRDHLVDGGRVVLTTPYPFGYEMLAYAWLKYPRTCPNPEHTLWLCPQTMLRLAKLCEFTVEQCHTLVDDREAHGVSPYQWAIRASKIFRRLPRRISCRTVLYVLR